MNTLFNNNVPAYDLAIAVVMDHPGGHSKLETDKLTGRHASYHGELHDDSSREFVEWYNSAIAKTGEEKPTKNRRKEASASKQDVHASPRIAATPKCRKRVDAKFPMNSTQHACHDRDASKRTQVEDKARSVSARSVPKSPNILNSPKHKQTRKKKISTTLSNQAKISVNEEQRFLNSPTQPVRRRLKPTSRRRSSDGGGGTAARLRSSFLQQPARFPLDQEHSQKRRPTTQPTVKSPMGRRHSLSSTGTGSTASMSTTLTSSIYSRSVMQGHSPSEQSSPLCRRPGFPRPLGLEGWGSADFLDSPPGHYRRVPKGYQPLLPTLDIYESSEASIRPKIPIAAINNAPNKAPRRASTGSVRVG